MNKPIILGAVAALTAFAALGAAKAANDPVLMTVNGKKVTLSEFEYLYHKNNAQQVQPQTLDEYLEMFVNYKLKVADAEAAGIDTTAAFISEFEGYRNDLADPYLVDKQFEDSLVNVAYNHMKEAVQASHIMVALADSKGRKEPQVQLLDSLRQLIAAGADFEQLARNYSVDQTVAVNGGSLGYIVGGQYPYAFEDAVYNTPEGQVSEVFATRVGNHIVKTGKRKPNPGEVHVRHILKVTRGVAPEQAALKKAQIDSIYALLQGGADFAEVAKMESEDPGSGRNGGELPWFTLGRMVPEFETVAFALADNEMSEPFLSPFGWHIIKRIESRELPSLETMRPDIMKAMERDERHQWMADRRVAAFAAKYPVKVNEAVAAEVKGALAVNGVDSLARANWRNSDQVAATVGDEEVTVGDVIGAMGSREINAKQAASAYDFFLKQLTENILLDMARENLALTNSEYRNLIGEYRDGMLLYEISNRNVWDRASKDTAGLQKYFEANRDNYSWQQPHYKGYIVLATTDSVADLAKGYLNGRSYEVLDSLNADLRRQFGRNAKAERVVTARGDNPIVDYVAFEGPRPAAQKGRKLNSWFAFEGRIITEPEEASDVKGAVSTDYQQELEREWIEQLRAKYPVKINNKVLKKVK